MKKFIVAILLLNVLFVSCKKKEKEPTKEELLTNGKWKLTSASAAGGLYDLMTAFKDCQKDNTFTFNSDKSITVDEGASKCSDTAKQSTTDGKWALTSNNTKMTISGDKITAGFGDLTGDIVKIEASTFQIKKDTVVSGFATSAIVTFTNVK
ncbi:MAG: DUF5004 domain-containing protein [Bacteroidota bacterium]